MQTKPKPGGHQTPGRMPRINRLIRSVLGELVPAELSDPRLRAVDLVVIQDVQTSPDLRQAKVFVSVQGPDDKAREAALEGLEQAKRFLRREIGRRVKLRHTPELLFVCDDKSQASVRVQQILGEIAAEPTAREITLAEAVETLRSAERVLITTHPDPDGDAIGSALAIALTLSRMGKAVVCFNPDPVPERLSFLTGAESFVADLPEDVSFDLTVIVDCSDARMFGAEMPSGDRMGPVLVLDHHKTVGSVADLIHRDVEAASTGVIVYRLLCEMGVDLDLSVAEALYCSVLSDTGSFRYGNTNPEALQVAAALLECGVDPWHVASSLYESRPARQLELLALVLRTLKVSANGWSAALLVTDQMLQDSGCTSDMVDGFINYARALQGVEVGILMRLQTTGLRVSLRSRGAIDVSSIAAAMGGGGHHNAAGFTVRGTPEGVLRQLFDEVRRRCIAVGVPPAGTC